jgi:hypothetical protein
MGRSSSLKSPLAVGAIMLAFALGVPAAKATTRGPIATVPAAPTVITPAPTVATPAATTATSDTTAVTVDDEAVQPAYSPEPNSTFAPPPPGAIVSPR